MIASADPRPTPVITYTLTPTTRIQILKAKIPQKFVSSLQLKTSIGCLGEDYCVPFQMLKFPSQALQNETYTLAIGFFWRSCLSGGGGIGGVKSW